MPELQLQNCIKPEVLKQSAYIVESPSCLIKLNQNESPWDWPDEMKQEILTRIRAFPWNRYPDLFLKKLKNKATAKLGVAPDSIVIAKGSNEILQAICNVSLRPLDSVCTLSPTFTLYRLLSEQRGATVHVSPLGKDFQPNVPDLLDKSRKARLNVICNPNSPTGTLVSPDLITEVAETTNGLVIVDEAYIDFSGVTALPLLKQYFNLVVTRTFSKAYALAGFRIGYAIMHPELRNEVQKGLLPFNLDISSCVAMEVLLDYSELVQNRARKIVQVRDRLIAKLNDLKGVKAWSSHANFFLLETPLGAKGIFRSLLEEGILVRDVSSYPGCERMVRVTVGTTEENETLYESVKKIV